MLVIHGGEGQPTSFLRKEADMHSSLTEVICMHEVIGFSFWLGPFALHPLAGQIVIEQILRIFRLIYKTCWQVK